MDLQQFITTIVTPLVIVLMGTLVKISIERYIRRRDAEIVEKKIKMERMQISIDAIDYGLKKSPALNGTYTKARNEEYERLEKLSPILNK